MCEMYMTIIRYFKMKNARILNAVHAVFIAFIYFAPWIFEQGNQNLCFDEKHTQIATINLLQAVLFGILIIPIPKETILAKYYDPICFILTIISCFTLFFPIVNISKSCEAGIPDLFKYIPTHVTIVYAIPVAMTCLFCLCDRDCQQQVEETSEPSV